MRSVGSRGSRWVTFGFGRWYWFVYGGFGWRYRLVIGVPVPVPVISVPVAAGGGSVTGPAGPVPSVVTHGTRIGPTVIAIGTGVRAVAVVVRR